MTDMILKYLGVFLVGGAICAIGQILIDKTKLTSARILVLFVVLGAVLTLPGIYGKIFEIGKAGATVPITGFGYLMAKGTFAEIDKSGFIGVFTGGLKSSAAGLTAAMLFGYLVSIAANPKPKR